MLASKCRFYELAEPAIAQHVALSTAFDLQQVLWAIDGAALVAATSLLSLKFFRKGNDLIAAGFLVYALGESATLSGTAAGATGSVPAFAAGTALWATALPLVSIPRDSQI
jgi:hypothetical protein